MAFDISALIARGHGMKKDLTPARPTADDVDTDMGAGFLATVAALALSRTPNARGRYWLAPTDFGALGMTANPGVDEGDYICWALLLGKYAAERVGSVGDTPYSVYLGGVSGGYYTGQFMEVQDKQQLYGDLVFTITDNGGYAEDDTLSVSGGPHLTFFLDDFFEGMKEANSLNGIWPMVAHAHQAENIIVEKMEVDCNVSSKFVNGSLDTVLTEANGYSLATLNTDLRDTSVGDGIGFVPQSGRSLLRHATIDNVWVHNCLGTNLNAVLVNHATGIIVVGNSAGSRAAYYPGEFHNGLTRLYMYGRNKNSNMRIHGEGSISNLIVDQNGPFGDGWASSVYTLLFQDEPTQLITTEGRKSHSTGPLSDKQPINIAYAYLDGAAYVADGGCAGFSLAPYDLTINLCRTKNILNKVFTPQDESYYDDGGAQKFVRTCTWTLTIEVEDGVNGNAGMPNIPSHYADGTLNLTVTNTADSLDNYNLDNESVVNSIVRGGIQFDIEIDANPAFREVNNKTLGEWTVNFTSDWIYSNLAKIQSYDGPGDLWDRDNVVPLKLYLKPVCSNPYPMYFGLGSGQTVKKPDPPYPNTELKYWPVHVLLLKPASGPTWDEYELPRFSFTAGSAEMHPEIYTEHDYSTAYNTYRRVYIVADADKAAANTNMENAGHGANCFSIALSKAGSDYWAACLVAGDANKGHFEEPVSAGVAVFDELTVSGTGPSGFRDAILAGGYTA